MIRKKHILRCLAGVLVSGMVLLLPGYARAEEKKTIYNSPYVSFSPDGEAFTTCAGDRDYKWYAENDSTSVSTGIASSLRNLEKGEHYYRYERYGEIPVGSWKVVHRVGQCIHDGYPYSSWHGLLYRSQKCMKYYYSGWKAFCADCGEEIEEANIYMSREAAVSIQYLDVGAKEAPMNYYYLCPFCRNLEQGVAFSGHQCKDISRNQYVVHYDSNHGGNDSTEAMPVSYHMYDNATEYEGETVTPVTHLMENGYSRTGYMFAGWNTRPDGSGTSYEDQAEIYNLCSGDWQDRSTWEGEDHGQITLYAQWRENTGTFVIDAAGGTYDGLERYSITGSYAEVYRIQEELLQPPAGYTVSFETNGGSKAAPITGTNHFVEWTRHQPFQGQMSNHVYRFPAADGNTDTVEAVYRADPVILPASHKEGMSFGGWYYDKEFTLPAGVPGGQLLPSGNVTLYAQWIDLKLQAVDNYRADGGRGAVDLSWSQADQNNKTYLLYQKRENGAWIRVNSAKDINSVTEIRKTFAFERKQQQYIVPYTGTYTIDTMGAQGQSYGAYHGGYGGSVSGTFWLKQGEILTCTVGGQDGYNGGGSASAYGKGGGMTSVVSNQKGILLIAGGGGGAYAGGHGGAGGSSASVVNGHNGQSGMTGGGAGYQGGTAGTYTTEIRELRLRYFKDVGLANTWQYITVHGSKAYGPEWSDAVGGSLFGIDRAGAGRYYQVNGKWQENTAADSYALINGQKWWPMDGWSIATDAANGNEVRVRLSETGIGQSWVGMDDPFCNGGTVFVQGYWAVTQPARNIPAYGGSNYVNKGYAHWYEDKSNVRSGNGYIGIYSTNMGYQDTLQLEGVTATDLAAPEKISDKVTVEALGNQKIRVSWTEPADRGTDYYHRVESYLPGNTSKLCDSNITKNTLTTGVKGYYWLIDQKEDTVATAKANYVRNPQADVMTADTVQYLHVAAVDAAGNLGETTHIRIEEGNVLWKIYTRQLSLDETAENVYKASDKTWYVRADGKTPFTLRNTSYMEGPARRDYQLNETIYETVMSDGNLARNRIYTPSSEIANGTLRTDASGLSYATEGRVMLQQYPYSYTIRSDRNKELTGVQRFVIDREQSGQRIQVIPIAGADRGAEKIYSVHSEDEKNKITLIPDGEAPVIRGMEVLENRELIDRREGEITLRVTAEDHISGIQKFCITIRNTDNSITQTFTPAGDGTITITITRDDPLFSGDFTVLGYAVDKVGNESSCVYGTTEFALESHVERILEPKDPIFKCGESGILTFTTWGYADRVEVFFPESMTALDPGLNKTYDYTEHPGYRITEELEFMVPLYTPENQRLEIIVRAYKGDKKLEDYPTISVIGISGTVLDELRTRLR